MTRPRSKPTYRNRKRRHAELESAWVKGTLALLSIGFLFLAGIPQTIHLPQLTQWGPQKPAHRAKGAAKNQPSSIATEPSIATDSDPSLSFELPNPTRQSQIIRPVRARPVSVISRTIAGVPIYLTTIDLSDPETFISVGLANNAPKANSARSTKGDESFIQLVRRNRAAVTASGTFFSMDAQKRVMGNLVAGGTFLKYSPAENYGTTLGIKAGNQLEMVTARVEGQPNWNSHWFSLTAGPRLLRSGKIEINAKREGFRDPAVTSQAIRSAIGFSNTSKKLLHVTFMKPVTLQREAQIMQALGCREAMNLDGGTSLALAKGGKILRGANRNLTNVITVYDLQHPAPKNLRLSWQTFQTTDRIAFQP